MVERTVKARTAIGTHLGVGKTVARTKREAQSEEVGFSWLSCSFWRDFEVFRARLQAEQLNFEKEKYKKDLEEREKGREERK